VEARSPKYRIYNGLQEMCRNNYEAMLGMAAALHLGRASGKATKNDCRFFGGKESHAQQTKRFLAD
jgi:hypothetical protein